MRSDDQMKQSARAQLRNLGFTPESVERAVGLLQKNRITIHNEQAEADAVFGQLMRQSVEDSHPALGRIVQDIEITKEEVVIKFTDGAYLTIEGEIRGGDYTQDPNASGRLSSLPDV